MTPAVAVDWDDTLVDPGTKEWLDGAVLALRTLTRLGYRVVIHTCRANWPEGQAEVRGKLAEAGFVEGRDYTLHGKPAAELYIDDRAVRFAGDWNGTLQVVPRHGRNRK